ncbi:hypothetical protein GUITHDRAFT_155089 [Guillardia theta CCMP2712]|uniref:SCP domain-containing protein n=2 Tax=Guillardia theta TaxID=55529 RepID=L1IM70_GUITC|nr:hypothetical protein GUITHDRAFT_155089 [Guillardia theta CCMP2712]EKX36999.1 hypothetical protein GUITHDRAFT_155089 [Guillardia theta CCMP2712]|eukprot:XP_005823979.1 hypothetical protein GUITHDRAFT_155089 [Guillardia theta CCMP2712]
MGVKDVGSIALLLLAVVAVLALVRPRPSKPSVLFFPSSSFHHEHLRKQVQQALRDGRRRQAALEEADRSHVLEHALQGEENSLGAEGLDLADYHEAIHDADRGSLRRRRSLGGIGTYPGGQSTGGSSEFTEENLRTHRPLTGKEEIMASEMRHKMWQVLDGGCKYANTTEELVECVSSAASLDQSDPLDQQALNIAKRQWHALRRPGSEEVSADDKEPSLEDVIAFNSQPEDLDVARRRMRGLQNQLDGIVNHRNFDSEHLTQETNDFWMAHTHNLCCRDFMDTECSSPCRF